MVWFSKIILCSICFFHKSVRFLHSWSNGFGVAVNTSHQADASLVEVVVVVVGGGQHVMRVGVPCTA